MNSKLRYGDAHFSAETSLPPWDKFLYCKCRNLIGGSSIAQAVNLCKLRCEKYCFRLIHFCPSLCLQVLFDECERMLHWFSYWFWWHFSVVSRFPWGEGRWTFFDIWFYFSVPLAEGRGCFFFFFPLSISFPLRSSASDQSVSAALLIYTEFTELEGQHSPLWNKQVMYLKYQMCYLLLVVLSGSLLLCGPEVCCSEMWLCVPL